MSEIEENRKVVFYNGKEKNNGFYEYMLALAKDVYDSGYRNGADFMVKRYREHMWEMVYYRVRENGVEAADATKILGLTNEQAEDVERWYQHSLLFPISNEDIAEEECFLPKAETFEETMEWVKESLQKYME